MTVIRFGAVTLAIAAIFATTAYARGADSTGCWKLLYKAIAASAAAPQAPYTSYNMSMYITRDGERFDKANAKIVYRYDGVEYVDDDRWVHPFVGFLMEPGAPVLGPFGDSRTAWLTPNDAPVNTDMQVIANTKTQPQYSCIDRGNENLDGLRYAHISMPGQPSDRIAVHEMWFDRDSLAIRRIVVSHPVSFVLDGKLMQEFIDYTLDVASVQGHQVITRVAWQRNYVADGEKSILRAQYVLSDFTFHDQPPAGTGSMFAQIKP